MKNHLKVSLELAGGADGNVFQRFQGYQEADDYDGTAARNEKGEKPLSVVKVVTKKTFIQTPVTVEEHGKGNKL